MTDKLEPCPFCGNRADWNEYEGATGAQYYCECVAEDGGFGCCKQQGGYATKSAAIKAWNARPADKPIDATNSDFGLIEKIMLIFDKVALDAKNGKQVFDGHAFDILKLMPSNRRETADKPRVCYICGSVEPNEHRSICSKNCYTDSDNPHDESVEKIVQSILDLMDFNIDTEADTVAYEGLSEDLFVLIRAHEREVRKAALEECWQIAMGWDMGMPIADDISNLIEKV